MSDERFLTVTAFDPHELTSYPPTGWWCRHAPSLVPSTDPWASSPRVHPLSDVIAGFFWLGAAVALAVGIFREALRRRGAQPGPIGSALVGITVGVFVAQLALSSQGYVSLFRLGQWGGLDTRYLASASPSSIRLELASFLMLAALPVVPLVVDLFELPTWRSLAKQILIGACASVVVSGTVVLAKGIPRPLGIAYGLTLFSLSLAIPVSSRALSALPALVRIPKARFAIAGLLLAGVVACSILVSGRGTRMAPPEARGEREIPAAGYATTPFPSPDGSKIAFVETELRFTTEGYPGEWVEKHVRVMNADGAHVTGRLAERTTLIGWTRDGRLIGQKDKYADVGEAFLLDLEGRLSHGTDFPDDGHRDALKVCYSSTRDSLLWVGKDHAIAGPRGAVVRVVRDSLGDMVLLAPDERHLAVLHSHNLVSNLVVIDLLTGRSVDFGLCPLFPPGGEDCDGSGECHGLTWTPWFGDGSRLAFLSEGSIVVASPDSTSKAVICRPGDHAGIPTASPDGKRIAFVTFERQVNDMRPIWGESTVWVVASTEGAQPRRVTKTTSDAIRSLRWIDNDQLVFDRLPADCDCHAHGRIWTVDVPPEQ